MKTLSQVTLAACFLRMAMSSPSFALSYKITDLGRLPYPNSYLPNAINASGQTVGRASLHDNGGPPHAYLYTPGSGITDLGTLEGDHYSEALGINDLGQVVGYSSVEKAGDRHAFLYTPGVGMINLGTLGGASSTAYAVNDAGQVVGKSITSASSYDHAFLWQNGVMQDVGTLRIDDYYNAAYAVNARGQVVGASRGNNSYPHAFVLTPGLGMTEINVVVDPDSRNFAINDAGQVTGSFFTGNNWHGFLYSPESGLTDLGILPGMYRSYASGINNAGQVVGYCSGSYNHTSAFLYSASYGMVDLGSLGGTQSRAYHIDDTGRVVGTSLDASGSLHLVAWEAVPEPSSILALLTGLAGIGGVAWRRRIS